MNSLAKIPGMLPYIELAYNQSDLAAEQQAIALSGLSVPISPASEDKRLSSISQGTSSSSSNSNVYLSQWNTSLYTFASGILPAQISYDPVTPISKLFKQGVPLCLLFNTLKPENAIDIVSSDDLKICKTNIYQFLSACKLHLNIRDDELFPITMVFSDNTSNLLRVIHSVNFVLNLEPSYLSPPIPDQLKITDSRSKVVKEFIETERRFVQDLETLINYRDELIKSELISTEIINALFPNLNDIIDFQRRFLIGLECNASVPSKYQRIGSIFIHAGVEGFKIYEPWSLLQSIAYDLIKTEAHKLRKASSIIKDPYDLPTFFLIKPIQRLTKYPLLLSQLLKETDQSWPTFNELHQAFLISKEVATCINEATRKSENILHLSELNEKVVDWKGYNTRNIGDLLYFNVVTVKDLLTDGHSNEKEAHCYLFEKVIYLFKDISSSKKILGSKKMSAALSNKLDQSNGNNHPSQLALNGIVYVNKIYKILPSETSPYFANSQGHFLTLRWKGNKDTGGCIMKFRSDEHLNQWSNTLRKLSIENIEDNLANNSFGNHNSNKSLSSIASSSSLLTTTNRSSNTSSSTNRNSDRLRSSSDSNTFMKKLRSTSTSSFSNLTMNNINNNNNSNNNISNISYPPLPTEKNIRSLSISSNYNSRPNTPHNSISTSNTNLQYNEEIASTFSNLTLSNNNSTNNIPIDEDDLTNIKLIFNSKKSNISISVNSNISYNGLLKILIKKMNYSMGSDNAFKDKDISFKFKDEDGDFIRFNGEDDWTIAKEMLEELEDDDSRILEIVASK